MVALRRALRFQAAYYIAAGLWPIISYASFESVTGPKTDDWLVKTVGLLVTVIGATLAAATARRERPGTDVLVLAIGAAAAFVWIGTWYALSNRISVIYLADAALELSLITWIVIARARDGRPTEAVEPPAA